MVQKNMTQRAITHINECLFLHMSKNVMYFLAFEEIRSTIPQIAFFFSDFTSHCETMGQNAWKLWFSDLETNFPFYDPFTLTVGPNMEFFSTVAHFYKLKNPLNVFLWIFRLISVTCSVYLVTLAFNNKTGVTIVRYPEREESNFREFLFEVVHQAMTIGRM